MPTLSIIVADDHPLIRAGLKEVLSADPVCNLTAFARSGGECLALIRRLHPDVALINANISLPDGSHILREIRADRSRTQVCFLTGQQIPQHLIEAAEDGAAFFVNAHHPEHLRARLHNIARRLTSQRNSLALDLSAQLPHAANTDFSKRLTRRQNQIVAMLKLGSTNRQIAHVLGLTEATVKGHLHRIYRTIGVSNRTQLTAQCFASQ
jgi:DNA-binding NarL/FixJ family response regulator